MKSITINRDSSEEDKIKYFSVIAKEIKDNISSRKKSLIVEFSGLPKSGKTTVINSLSLFLRRNKILSTVINERASDCPIKDKQHPDFNIWTASITLSHILALKNSNDYHVIIVDRGIFDSLIWMNLAYKNGKISKNELEVIENFYLLDRHRKAVDIIIHMECAVMTSLEREYKDTLTDVPGSIMNEQVLADLLESSSLCRKKYVEYFNKITKIDTTKTTTIEGVFDVVKVVTESMKELSDEIIVSIPKNIFDKRLGPLSLSYEKKDFKVLERIIKSSNYANRRSFIENDKTKIQIVVICVLKYENMVAVFRKSEISENKRFDNKDIVWIGGHLQKNDIDNHDNITVHKSMVNCLKRELYEEIRFPIESAPMPVYKGMVYDRSHSKSLQHLGVIFQINITKKQIKDSLNRKSFPELSGQRLYLEFIELNENKINEKFEYFEPWSKYILNKFYDMDVKSQYKDRQLVMF